MFGEEIFFYVTHTWSWWGILGKHWTGRLQIWHSETAVSLVSLVSLVSQLILNSKAKILYTLGFEPRNPGPWPGVLPTALWVQMTNQVILGQYILNSKAKKIVHTRNWTQEPRSKTERAAIRPCVQIAEISHLGTIHTKNREPRIKPSKTHKKTHKNWDIGVEPAVLPLHHEYWWH